MALDHLIKIPREHFGIVRPEDWTEIRPEWILQLHGCGPSVLDHLRLYLAARGLTLRDDQTPNYWMRNADDSLIGGRIASTDRKRVEAFTILVDTAEKYPFTFQGYAEGGKPIIVPTEFKSLGPTHGDYSISGLEGDAHVERKSMNDAHGTFLSHGERRERWIRTMEFLAGIPCSAIVVECSIGVLINNVEVRGTKTKATLQKTLHRQILAWANDYRIPFHFCDGSDKNRRLSEATTLSILRRRWLEVHGLKKRTKLADDLDIISTL